MSDEFHYPLAADASVHLVQITDPHLFADPNATLLGVNTAHSLQQILNVIDQRRQTTDLLLATGDLTQDHSAASYGRFVEMMDHLGLPCHVLPGNHDETALFESHVHGAHVFQQKHILIGAWQILLLDSTIDDEPKGYLAETEFAFIEQALAKYPERHTLLALHHHPILTGSYWLDQHFLENGEQLLAWVADKPQIKGILWGHVHQQIDQHYPRQNISPLTLMATPSTCIQFKPLEDGFRLDAKQPGYRALTLHANGNIESQVHRLAGNEFIPDFAASGY